MTLPLETINGKQYQPVESTDLSYSKCWKCCFVCDPSCDGAGLNCYKSQRDDGLDIYFIEPGDTNEQEQ